LPPKLSTPAADTMVSRLALHFSWYQTANAVEYELQVSKAWRFRRGEGREELKWILQAHLKHLLGSPLTIACV
jgi:hypothetical protein